MSPTTPERPGDRVTRGIELWAREVPELDTSGMEVVARILRLGTISLDAIESALQEFGLKAREYSVLAILRTHGAPGYQAPPKVLIDATFLTTGGLSNLLDRLEKARLVTRVPDPKDRRSIVVKLTPRGLELVGRAVEAVSRVERALIAGLTEGERERLATLLGSVLGSVDPVPISLR